MSSSPKPVKAPVIPYEVEFAGTATSPAMWQEGTSGVFTIIVKAVGGSCFVITGATEDMDVADSSSWPLAEDEEVEWTIGAGMRWFSVIEDSGPGSLLYYVPGQSTEI